MTFDVNDSADLAALKTEVNNDPITMGYAAVVSQTTLLLKLLNDPANNVGGETAATPLTPETLWDAVDAGEYSGNPLGDQRGLIDILLNRDPGTNLEPMRAKVLDIFGNGPTEDALALQTSALSRSEVLFGQGTIISRTDWATARDS